METWTWRHEYGDLDIVELDMTKWRNKNRRMETWKHGNMESWRHGYGEMDMVTWTWRYGHEGMDMEIWT